MTHKIHLGCCAFSFDWLALPEALQLVHNLGFTHVDVGANQIGQDYIADDPSWLAAELRNLAQLNHLTLDEFFVTAIQVQGTAVVPNHPDADLRAQSLVRFEALCACAAEAGFRSIMGVPGNPQPDTTDAEAWDIAVETLTHMVAIAQDAGLRFHVEPHAGSIAATPDRALKLVRKVRGLAYTLDYAHFIGQGIAQDAVVPLHAHAGHLHAKPARPGYPKCLAHASTIDFGAIVADLTARGWTGTLATECIGRLDPQSGRPVYQEVSAQTGALPPAPGLLGHPVAQTMAVAHELARHLSAKP